MSQLKKWENDIYKFDVQEASRTMNPWLKNYGRDRYTFKPESTYTSTMFLDKYEGPHSHGYPATAYL